MSPDFLFLTNSGTASLHMPPDNPLNTHATLTVTNVSRDWHWLVDQVRKVHIEHW